MARSETSVAGGASSATGSGSRTRATKSAKPAGTSGAPHAGAQSDAPEASTGHGMPLLRTAGAVAYAPVAVTVQLLARSRGLWYYAGVAVLAGAGAIEWPVAGVVIAGVWIARHRPSSGGTGSGSTDS